MAGRSDGNAGFPLPAAAGSIDIAALTPHEQAEFIEPDELPNQPLAFDIADYEHDQLQR
jgi:hypothetical protein